MFTELVKHLSESDGTSWQSKDMNKARRRWESGEMSSQIFFGELIQAVFTSDHVISSLNLKVSEIPRESLCEGVQNSPILARSYQLGLAGENPPVNEILSAYNTLPKFHLIKKRNQLGWGGELEPVRIPNLKLIDVQLSTSLIAHAHYADWMPNLYPKRDEAFGEYHYFNAVDEAIADANEVMKVYKWIKSEDFLMTAHKRSVYALLAMVPDRRRPMLVLGDLESFFSKMSPAIYLSGWANRLVEITSQAKAVLPDYLTTEYERKLVTAAYFLRMKAGRTIVFGEVVAAVSQYDIEAAKRSLAQAHILSQGERALKQWQIRELGLEPAITQERESLIHKREANKMAGSAKTAIIMLEKNAERHVVTEEVVNDTEKWLVKQLLDLYRINVGESVFQISFKPSARNKMADEAERLVHILNRGRLDVSDLKSGVKVKFMLHGSSGRLKIWHYDAVDARKILQDAFENAEDANWEVEEVREVNEPN